MARRPIVGVVGALQLDVLKERLSAEYGLPVSFELGAVLGLPRISSEDRNDLGGS